MDRDNFSTVPTLPHDLSVDVLCVDAKKQGQAAKPTSTLSFNVPQCAPLSYIKGKLADSLGTAASRLVLYVEQPGPQHPSGNDVVSEERVAPRSVHSNLVPVSEEVAVSTLLKPCTEPSVEVGTNTPQLRLFYAEETSYGCWLCCLGLCCAGGAAVGYAAAKQSNKPNPKPAKPAQRTAQTKSAAVQTTPAPAQQPQGNVVTGVPMEASPTPQGQPAKSNEPYQTAYYVNNDGQACAPAPVPGAEPASYPPPQLPPPQYAQ